MNETCPSGRVPLPMRGGFELEWSLKSLQPFYEVLVFVFLGVVTYTRLRAFKLLFGVIEISSS